MPTWTEVVAADADDEGAMAAGNDEQLSHTMSHSAILLLTTTITRSNQRIFNVSCSSNGPGLFLSRSSVPCSSLLAEYYWGPLSSSSLTNNHHMTNHKDPIHSS